MSVKSYKLASKTQLTLGAVYIDMQSHLNVNCSSGKLGLGKINYVTLQTKNFMINQTSFEIFYLCVKRGDPKRWKAPPYLAISYSVHLLGMSCAYLKPIFGISLAFLWQILGIS